MATPWPASPGCTAGYSQKRCSVATKYEWQVQQREPEPLLAMVRVEPDGRREVVEVWTGQAAAAGIAWVDKGQPAYKGGVRGEYEL